MSAPWAPARDEERIQKPGWRFRPRYTQIDAVEVAKLEIAILGTRGIPGRYGGFETFAEELSVRLAERGHQITVYCRSGIAPNGGAPIGVAPNAPEIYRGVQLVHLPAIHHKYAETLSHTLLSAVHALFQRYDIVYVCNSANAPICWIPWMRRQQVVLNVDGLEWQRAKWGRLARRYYRWAAKHAAHMPIEIVTDAEVIRAFYERTWGRRTRSFAYGATLYERGYLAERVHALGLEPDGYLLYVSRMEPENNALLVVQGYARVNTNLPLVMVGDAPYAREYVDRLRAAADPRVRFMGYRFGDDYHALQANARLYIQATEVGGTHPALVEALGHGNAVVAHDVPEHREVLGDAGVYFAYRDTDDLANRIRDLLDAPRTVTRLREAAQQRVVERYSWDAVTDEYESYFTDILAARGTSR